MSDIHDIRIENVLLQFANRILDVRADKENPTVKELVDQPVREVRDLAVRALVERHIEAPDMLTVYEHETGTYRIKIEKM